MIGITSQVVFALAMAALAYHAGRAVMRREFDLRAYGLMTTDIAMAALAVPPAFNVEPSAWSVYQLGAALMVVVGTMPSLCCSSAKE